MKFRAKNQIFPLKYSGSLCIAIIILLGAESKADEKCLLNKPEVVPKKFLYFEGQHLNITLEMSNTVSHQLYTHVFKIFLQEVLGYPQVEIVPEENNYNMPVIIKRLSHDAETEQLYAPKTMINLGVLVPSDVDTSVIYHHHVQQYGTIAPPVRFGWFIPFIHKTNEFPPRTYDQDVHWTFFKDLKNVYNYDIQEPSDWHLIHTNSFSDFEKKEYYCMDMVCANGMFIPEQCKGSNNRSSSCAVLLAPYYNSTKFVVGHINQLQLLVKVVWLGPNLNQVVTQLRNNYQQRDNDKGFIILNWSPSEIITDIYNFIPVNFKHCELLFSSEGGCKYDLQRQVKLSWNKLKQLARPVFESLYKVEFSVDDYNLLLKLYNRKSNTTVADVACDWMRQKSSVWKRWDTYGSRKNVIYLAGIFPITGSSYNGKGILQGALMAKDAINHNNSLLHDYNLVLLATNSQCKADKIMTSFIKYIVENYYSNVVGLLGPACLDSAELFVEVLKNFRTLMISYSAEGVGLSDRDRYPYFFRTTGEYKDYKQAYLQIFKALGWKRVGVLIENEQKRKEFLSYMKDLFQHDGITFTANNTFPMENDMFTITQYLEDLKHKRNRIIIVDVHERVARLVMCAAFKLSMTAKQGYVWFLPAHLNLTWYNATYFNSHAREEVNCTTENIIEAINGHFLIRFAFFAPDNAIMQENITVGEWRERYVQRAKLLRGHTPSDYHASFAYDAVWTYALALDKLIKEDPRAVLNMHTQKTTDKLIKLVKDTDFNGVSGRIKYRKDFSRNSVINVLQWLNNNTRIIDHFYFNDSEDSTENFENVLEFNTSAITWLTPDGKKPDDGSLS